MIERPLGLGLLAPVERDLEDDALASQGEVAGQEDPGRAPLANQGDELEFLEMRPGLRESGVSAAVQAGRLAEETVVLKLREPASLSSAG